MSGQLKEYIERDGDKIYYYQLRKYKTVDGQERECLCKTTHKTTNKPRGKPALTYTSKQIKEYKKALEANEGNVLKTAKELNVPYNRIAKLK
jgi:hypothetical protein